MPVISAYVHGTIGNLQYAAGVFSRILKSALRSGIADESPFHRDVGSLQLLLRMETGDDRVNASYDMERSRTLAPFMEITDQAEGTFRGHCGAAKQHKKTDDEGGHTHIDLRDERVQML